MNNWGSISARVMWNFSLHRHGQKVSFYWISYSMGTSTRCLSHVADITTTTQFHLMLTKHRYKQYLWSSYYF